MIYTIMRPKKRLIETAIADGSMERLNQLLSAAHLLNCEANNLVEEASEVMQAKGLLLGNLKKLHTDFVKCADCYFKEFASMINSDKSKMDLFDDLEGFDKAFREWAKVPSGWKPKEVKG